MNINQVCDRLQILIKVRLQNNISPIIVGISGGQGSGKSTLSRILSKKLEIKKIPSAVLSLDDFYHTKDERKKLSREIHPLAVRRGVPGTHDTAFLNRVLSFLRKQDYPLPIKVPIFEKGIDDRKPPEFWPSITEYPRVVFIEGWCIGAFSESLAATPETEWELNNDPKGIWKKWTKNQAKNYEEIWNSINFLIFIEQKDFNQVVEDRWRQEQKILSLNQSHTFQTKEEVREFCNLFESWTYQIWKFCKSHANVTLKRDLDYNFSWEENYE